VRERGGGERERERERGGGGEIESTNLKVTVIKYTHAGIHLISKLPVGIIINFKKDSILLLGA
jgi:hypothetical protein